VSTLNVRDVNLSVECCCSGTTRNARPCIQNVSDTSRRATLVLPAITCTLRHPTATVAATSRRVQLGSSSSWSDDSFVRQTDANQDRELLATDAKHRQRQRRRVRWNRQRKPQLHGRRITPAAGQLHVARSVQRPELRPRHCCQHT